MNDATVQIGTQMPFQPTGLLFLVYIPSRGSARSLFGCLCLLKALAERAAGKEHRVHIPMS